MRADQSVPDARKATGDDRLVSVGAFGSCRVHDQRQAWGCHRGQCQRLRRPPGADIRLVSRSRALLARGGEQLRHRIDAERPAQQFDHRPGLDRLALFRATHATTRRPLAACARSSSSNCRVPSKPNSSTTTTLPRSSRTRPLAHAIDEHRKRRPVRLGDTGAGEHSPPAQTRKEAP